MMRMAWRIAVRTTGSPLRLISRPNIVPRLLRVFSDKATSLPVSIRPQVPALTRMEELLPR